MGACVNVDGFQHRGGLPDVLLVTQDVQVGGSGGAYLSVVGFQQGECCQETMT